MDTIIEQAFWHYATALISFIIPAIVLYLLFRWLADLVLGSK